jgi:hypothetical protein
LLGAIILGRAEGIALFGVLGPAVFKVPLVGVVTRKPPEGAPSGSEEICKA